MAAGAQAASLRRIGVLWHAASAEDERDYRPVLHKAFADLGYVEGETIVLEERYPAEQPDKYRLYAQQFADSRLDAIVAVTALGAAAAKQATSTIPIVFVFAADPVRQGLVSSLARPGGNATGLSLMSIDLTGKCLSLFKEAVPNLSRVGLLLEMDQPANGTLVPAYRAAADQLGLTLTPIEASTPASFETAFSALARAKVDGVVVGSGSLLFTERARIGALAQAHGLPSFVSIGEMVPYGALMSYGQDFPDYFRRAASYVDKILRGATPANLPVEQPTQLKLVLNRATASRLGLAFSPTLLAAADEVIE